MVFPYYDYFNESFKVPILLFLFVFLILFIGLIFKAKSSSRRWKEIISDLVVLAFFGVLFLPPFVRGFSLQNETEADAVKAQGTVEEIKGMFIPTMYKWEGKNVFSKYIVIDGEKYYCMTGDCVEIGEQIQFEYLPESKYILRIDKVGEGDEVQAASIFSSEFILSANTSTIP